MTVLNEETPPGAASPSTGRRPRRRRAAPRDLLTLCRPYQWPKNLLVVPVPLLHAEAWTAAGLWGLAHALVAFTLASALVYVGNDLADRERDRHDPAKRHRPLASGRLAPRAALALGALLAAALGCQLALVTPESAWPIGLYLLINLAYSCGLKQRAVLEVFLVASGFQLRVLAGYLAVDLPVSGWLVTCVFLLCLLFVLGKRRREVDRSGPAHRAVLRAYTTTFLDQAMAVSAALAAGTFLLFLGDDLGSRFHTVVPLLLPLVLLGCFRYLWCVTVAGRGADPVRTLLHDRMLLVDAALCAAVLALAKLGPADALPLALAGGPG